MACFLGSGVLLLCRLLRLLLPASSCHFFFFFFLQTPTQKEYVRRLFLRSIQQCWLLSAAKKGQGALERTWSVSGHAKKPRQERCFGEKTKKLACARCRNPCHDPLPTHSFHEMCCKALATTLAKTNASWCSHCKLPNRTSSPLPQLSQRSVKPRAAARCMSRCCFEL